MTDALKVDAEVPDLESLRGVEEESRDENLDLTHPFDPSKIRVTTEPRTIDSLVRRIRHDEIDLAPEFQRRARLWKLHKKGQLIESILLRIPLPVFYVAATEDDMWSVVDGLQRLTTINDFLSNGFKLSGLEYLSQLEGMSFADLPRAMQRRIEETSLVLNIIQPGTPDEVMINIFRRLNTGGLPLEGQEIRNALYKGPVRDFLAKLAGSEEFLRATDGRVSDLRMDAQECALRFCAFFMDDWRAYDRGDLDAYLSEAMKRVNALTDEQRGALANHFANAMNVAFRIFGDDAFRKRYRVGETRKPVSKALFEAWSVNIAGLGHSQQVRLIETAPKVRELFMKLMLEDRAFEVSISSSTGSVQRVHKRFEAIQLIILAALEG
ncbi:DUF262 domain-containing protein [Caulobacter sp. 3R27C2-B]|uniref:DUF262 domain-containing protein n=1 Tax=Caulobacter sp. 3R27C2-B TaxID=2502219 RepID=UPI0014852392|nr:DUF262 domain-containing protein [Caulobacter sp. 3R27C2-B]